MTELCMVGEFHKLVGIAEGRTPGSIERHTALLHYALVMEELSELGRAWACQNRLDTLDALTDTQYIVNGFIRVCGFNQKIKVGPTGSRGHNHNSLFRGLTTDLLGVMQAIEGEQPSDILTAFSMLDWGIEMAYTLSGMDVLKDRAYDIVHESNMTKEPSRDGSGKVLKGDNYRAPSLSALLQWHDLPKYEPAYL